MRRDFLKFCGLAGLAVVAPIGMSSTGRAQTGPAEPYEGPYYVVFNASGGWDTTYLMDPKGVGGMNRLYLEGDILTKGRHTFAPTAAQVEAGMSNEAFYDEYGDELLVVNGIDYSVNNHSPCSRYMATGKLDSLAYPTFAALVAACKGSDLPLAFLTFGNYSATGNLVPMARVPYLSTLKLITNSDAVNGGAASYFDPFVSDRIDQALESQFDERMGEPSLPRVEGARSMLFTAQLNSDALRRITPFVAKNAPEERLALQAEIALVSFRAGVSVSANLSIGQFDSHANNDRDQMKLIPELLSGIDYLMKRAEALGIREKLVVVVQSEMARTPFYNEGAGKDHWSMGSIMFMGKQITGNRVIGATDKKQHLEKVNPRTLEVDKKSGIRVRPEHIHEALRQHAGLAEHEFTKGFPLALDEEERLTGLWG